MKKRPFEESLVKDCLEESPIAVMVVDQRLRICRANKAACDFLGYSKKELGRKSVTDITFPADRGITRKFIRELWGTGVVPRGLEKRYIHKNGLPVWGEVAVRVMKDGTGKPFAIAHILDITARKHAEEERRRSEVRYRRLHESLRDAFVSVAMDGRIQDFNEIYRNMLGYDTAELFTKTYMDLTPAKWRAGEMDIVKRQILKRGYSDVYEKEYRRKDGSVFPVELRTVLIRNDAGKPVQMWALVRDITERKQIEKSLKRAKLDLEKKVRERTRKLRELTGELTQAEHKERRRIAYILHEDIQQRLVATQYQVQAVIKNDPPPMFREAANRISGELAQVVELTRSLTSDLRPPVLYELGLRPALEWLAGDFERRFGLDVGVHVKEGKGNLSDELRIFAFEAIRELLLNVVKHAGVKYVSVEVMPEGRGKVEILVKDEGCGFDSVRSMNKRDKFGLFSIRERAEALGGRFQIISRPGKGTRSKLILPHL